MHSRDVNADIAELELDEDDFETNAFDQADLDSLRIDTAPIYLRKPQRRRMKRSWDQ